MDDLLLAALIKLPDFQKAIENAVKAYLDVKDQQPDPVFYTEDEACKILRISKPSCYKYRKLGYLKARMVGRRLLFSREDIEEAARLLPSVKYSRV